MIRRWPLIRHVRYLWYAWEFAWWWEQVGRHRWLVPPNKHDLDFLDDVWAGRA